MKKYIVNVKKIKEIELQVEAKNEEEAMDKATDIVNDTNIFSLNLKGNLKEKTEYQAYEILEELEENECESCEYYCQENGECNYSN
ncbi:MAG: hypothetical protein PHO88_02725 [Clostridia bacterium]|nr:hypothetical protein [Clostridia bacterium]